MYKMTLKLIKCFMIDAQCNQSNYRMCVFPVNINIFHHLKLEIVLAIPSTNE